MSFYKESTKGWCEKSILGIGRAYDGNGDLDVVYVDLFVLRIGWWFK